MLVPNLLNLLTLLSHSLRQESRSASSHRFRIGSLLVATWMLLSAHYYSWFVGGVGREFVRALTYLDLMLILVAGSSYFGSVITEEKEQGTLGLLKLAGFSNAGLMFGKSSARIVIALLIFLIQLPFAFLAIVLGGTTVTQIIAAYLALAAYLILLGNVGLFLSVVCRRNSSATSLTFIVGALALWSGRLAGFAQTAGIGQKVASVRSTLQAVRDFEMWFSAEGRLSAVMSDRRTPLVTGQFWASLGIAAGLFGLSWLLFDRFTEYTETHDPHRARSGGRTLRWQLWVTRPRGDAWAWKEFHFGGGGFTTLVGKSLVYAGLIVSAILLEARFKAVYGTSLPEIVHACLLAILLLECLAFSGSFLGSEFTGGTLPNLILTPNSLGRIVASKFWGGLVVLSPTLVAFAVGSFLLKGHDALLLDWNPRELVLVSGFVLLLHLTTFYSIRVRRGAVAWAVATLVLASVFVLPLLEMVRMSLMVRDPRNPLMSASDGPEVWAPLLYTSVLACLGLQIAISLQVRRAVGE